MNVRLIAYTPEPDVICGKAAAICTASDSTINALRGAMASGHESVIEHAYFTFHIEGVSRALLAQLTRHRLASFSVESQRYVNMGNMPYIVPATIRENEYVYDEFTELMMRIKDFYKLAIDEGIPEEDARFATPQAAATQLMISMNARELLHFFRLRTCRRAQWEIRELADKMLAICRMTAPELFKQAGCACMAHKPCPEGKRSCGHPRDISEVLAK